MNIMCQGLRRSGTSVFREAFASDSRLFSYSEPFNHAGVAYRGVESHDETQTLRTARAAFLESLGFGGIMCVDPNKETDSRQWFAYKHLGDEVGTWGTQLDLFFNRGTPLNPSLEMSTRRLNLFEKKYIQFLLDFQENCFLKFTRANFIIKDLFDLDPTACFIHLEKHPLKWVSSHICPSGQHLSPAIENADLFFHSTTPANTWGMESLAQAALISSCTDINFLSRPTYFRLLYVWKKLNDQIASEGQKYYGKKYIKITNKDFCIQPEKVIKNVYSLTNLSYDPSVTLWAQRYLQAPKPVLYEKDQRWFSAAEELQINLREWD